MMKLSIPILGAVIGVSFLAWTGEARGVIYSFTKIADDTVPVIEGIPIGKHGVINESGTVAFVAFLPGGERGLFVGNGGALTTIANTQVSDLDSVIAPSINDDGIVAFRATRDDMSEGIFTGSGGPTTPVIDSSSQFSNFGVSVTNINNAGTVGFFANADITFVLGYYLSGNGTLTTIVDNGSAGDSDFQSFSSPSLNDQGLVSFGGMLNNGTRGLYTSDGTTLNTILDQDDGFTSFFTFTGMNDSGAIVFSNSRNDVGSAIFTVADGTVTTIAQLNGPFSTFRTVGGINDAGKIVFISDLDGGGCGIYTGGDPATDKVIEVGDALDGSTVVELCSSGTEHGDGMMNNFGQIAFWAELADGRRGIFRADPDTDEDGVLDHLDPCPLDPADDSDGDGVCDSADVCPDANDADDADGDGVPDACDDTPNGEDPADPQPNAGCCGGGVIPLTLPLMLAGWGWMRSRRRG